MTCLQICLVIVNPAGFLPLRQKSTSVMAKLAEDCLVRIFAPALPRFREKNDFRNFGGNSDLFEVAGGSKKIHRETYIYI